MSRIAPTGVTRQRTQRQKAPSHLDHIRQLPCLVCHAEPPTDGSNDPMHLRAGMREYYKRPTGMGEKPSDCWTVPGCRFCHDRQHGCNETAFWVYQRIDPFRVALLLWAHSGDVETMRQIVLKARK